MDDQSKTSAPSAPEILTAQEAADFLRVTPWTVKNLHRVGTLRGVLISRKLRFRLADVRAYVSALVEGGGR